MINIRNIKQQAQSISTDIYLLQQYSQPFIKNMESTPTVSSMNALSNLLRHKNSRYNYSNEQRQRDQSWVINKRGDLRPLIKRVQQIKIKYQATQDQKLKSASSEFYMSPPNLQTQNKYIQKSLEYVLFSTVQHSLNMDNNRNNRVHKKKKLKQFNLEFNHKNSQDIKFTKNTRKLQDYLKAVRQLFMNNQRIQGKDWVFTFKLATKVRFWEIIGNLFRGYQKSQNQSSDVGLYKMALSSLKMVQSQFNSMLPSNYQSLLHYLTANYLRKLPGKFKTEGSLGPIWGICYLLYKSGRKQQFYQYIPNLQLRNKFQIVDESITLLKPQRIKGNQSNLDVFHDQLMYALQGSPKFSSQILCDEETLDIVWIFLRNVAIFPKQQEKFIQYQKQIVKSYKKAKLTETRVKNLIYLLCFQELVQYGPNQMIDQDDYLHFLIAVYHSPQLLKTCKSKDNMILKKLTERLIQFIEKLLTQGRKQSAYYISLMPYETLPNQISTLISSLKLLDKFKWQQIGKYIPRRIYEDLISQTCQKHGQMHNDFITAAEKQLQLLNNPQLALQLVVKMFIRASNSNRYEDYIIKKGQNLGKKIVNQNQRLLMEYGPVLQFFSEHREIVKLILERRQQKIYKFIKNCKHILISEKIRVDTQSVIEKLIKNEKNGFDCYILYMRDVIKGYQIALTKMGKMHQLQELQRLTLNALIGIQNLPQYSKYAKNQSLLALIRILEECLFNNI